MMARKNEPCFERCLLCRFVVMLIFASVSFLFFMENRLSLFAEDQPQWGEKFTRNMISEEKNLPESFQPGNRHPQTGLTDLSEAENVRWAAPLGRVVYGVPIVAEGRVLIGTATTCQPDREELQGDRGVLVCLDELTGEFLWELNVPKMYEIEFSDWHNVGMVSAPVVENGKVYLLTNRCEVVCLDLAGMKNGNQGPYFDEGKHCVNPGTPPIEPGDHDADILWLTDLVKTVGAMPHNATCCAILMDGDLLYLCTGNGVDWTHSRVMNPSAPTLVVLDKTTGQVLARDSFGLGPNIIHGQWSSPALGVANGRKLIFQGTGSGILFASDALTPEQANEARTTGKIIPLNKVWQFNGHPMAQTQDAVPLEHWHDTRSYEVVANPVFYQDKLFVVFTQELYHNIPEGWLTCLDATMTGDTTRRGGLIWSYPAMTSSGSTVAILDGLLYLVDNGGTLHCLDINSGKPFWTYKINGPVWGSPLVADGKVYIGNGRREFYIFQHGKEAKLLSKTRMSDQIFGTATAANGRLFIPVFGTLYCLEKGEDKR